MAKSTTPPAPQPARVWIEIERPSFKDFPTDELRHAEGKRRAAALSVLLVRLGYDPGMRAGPVCWWYEKKGEYCFVVDGSGGFVRATDSGHWLNLDWLAANPPVPKPPAPLGPTENVVSTVDNDQ
jgi:hypothetical protein